MSIYFFRSGADGPIKIGYAISAPSRYMAIAPGCPDGLHYIAAFSGSRWAESQLHRVFSNSKLRSEWFSPEPQVAEFVKTAMALGSIRAALTDEQSRGFAAGYVGVLEAEPDELTVAGAFIRSHRETLATIRMTPTTFYGEMR